RGVRAAGGRQGPEGDAGPPDLTRVPGRLAAVLSLCLFPVGCGGALSMKDSNRMYRAFGAVAYACNAGVKPTHWQLRQARAGMREMVAQYRETPDKRAQVGDGSDG